MSPIMLIPDKRAGKHNAPDHQACTLQINLTRSHVFYKLHTISMHLCNSFMLLAYMFHLHKTFSHVCNTCARPFTMSLTVAPNSCHVCLTCTYKHAFPKHLHCTSTSIHICYGNIHSSVLSAALTPDQNSINGCYNCTVPTGLYLTA